MCALSGKPRRDVLSTYINYMTWYVITREAMKEEIRCAVLSKEEEEMKRSLLLNAIDADIMIDLHCDSDAVVHMYTHDRLWPKMQDLAAEIGSYCHLLAPKAGGDPFDEACSCPWAQIADHFRDLPIPMACESATVELRGESDGTSLPCSATDLCGAYVLMDVFLFLA